MDILKNKTYLQFDYLSRFTGVPAYYNSQDDREHFGLCKNVNKNASYAVHKVTFDDTLHKLALKYYNNPSYWWLIAFFNDIPDAFVKLSERYTTLKIPNMSAIVFEDLR